MPEFPYATHLNIYYQHLQLIDTPALVAACTDQWYNQTLCQVNDAVVRLGVMQGEYHWHKHEKEDEFFFALDGHFIIDPEDRRIDLEPRQGLVVPKGVTHRTRAPEKAVILMVEKAGIVPTGDKTRRWADPAPGGLGGLMRPEGGLRPAARPAPPTLRRTGGTGAGAARPGAVRPASPGGRSRARPPPPRRPAAGSRRAAGS